MIKIVPLTNSKFDSGGQSYTAGDGIVISGGQIAATSTLLQDVIQEISSSYVAKSDSPDGGYFFITSSGATIGVSDTYRVSAGLTAATVKTNTSTGLYLSGTSVTLMNSGKTHYTAGLSVVALYGSTSAIALRLNSTEVAIKHSGDDGYNQVVHVGMSATSDTPGVVQPDNSTCTVASGGILSITPPTTLWASGNAGSEIAYPTLDGANVIRAYKNGLLMESGADYVIGSSGVVSYTTPLESSDKAAFEYYPAAPTRNIVPDGGKALKSAEPEDYIIDDEEEEGKGEER